MHNYISILQENKIEHGLIIFEGSPTSTVKNVIGNTPALGINIELFTADDLQFNITKHKLVPKHIRLSKEEAKQFKEKYGVNIPKLLRIDPVCRFYDFSTGDIIKIVRRDGFISFRIVR
jgi:DNA-directed RNA polymerase I, II, and III subunit RPABC1